MVEVDSVGYRTAESAFSILCNEQKRAGEIIRSVYRPHIPVKMVPTETAAMVVAFILWSCRALCICDRYDELLCDESVNANQDNSVKDLQNFPRPPDCFICIFCQNLHGK